MDTLLTQTDGASASEEVAMLSALTGPFTPTWIMEALSKPLQASGSSEIPAQKK
jgi:hypothetical protein